MWIASLLLGAIAVSASAIPQPQITKRTDTEWHNIYNVTVFSAPSDYTSPRTLYARSEIIPGTNDLLLTWENYSPEPPAVYFPIFKSTDGGETWNEISRVTDQVNGWGLRYQPFLYYLPVQIGAYPAGTLLLAGNSIPTDLSLTKIDVYASHDNGLTWSFVSHVASGGEAVPDNGLTPIWEPFLLAYDSQLIIYYSDQRDPAHGQKLVHQTSTDLLNWTDPVDDVAYPTYTDRPGMTTVTYLPATQEYMMTYEYGGGPTIDNSTTYQFPVYARKNANPLLFNSSPGYPIISVDPTDGSIVQPKGSPYITWTPAGNSVNGTILVSSGCCSQLFTSTTLGEPSSWETLDTGAEVSYTRSLRILPENDDILIAGGGLLPPVNNTAVKVDIRSVTSKTHGD